jgi:uncharacterized protein YhaN
LATRRAAERQHAEQAHQRATAVTELATAARQVGSNSLGESPAEHAEILQAWLAARETHLGEISEAQSTWTELVTLLEGDTVEQAEAAAQDAATIARQLSERTDKSAAAATQAAEHAGSTAAAIGHPAADTVTLHSALQEANAAVETARAQHGAAAAAANNTAGMLTERARTLTSVAEAEEALTAAETELTRVRTLDATLATTIGYLSRSQEQVHRSIAPLLAATLTEWLPAITAGRYIDGIVDPATLQVKVCGPDRIFRRAELLSHGTAEQVYLLLRTALAQHLTAGHQSCPLLLDDVTIQADVQRTPQILEMLHKLSNSRQIILFAQDPQVADWARANLLVERDSMVDVSPPS